MQILTGQLDHPAVIGLLQEHLDSMRSLSPPESTHALDLSGLKKPSVTFYSLWSDLGELMGCGAIMQLDAAHAEVKSMRTATAHLRKGVAQQILTHIMTQAQLAGYQRLSLETGSFAEFFPAHRLYEKNGFVLCPPFGDYVLDPLSVFMTKTFK